MRQVDLAALDLNLLVVLEALLAERHVTRAARRVHMSQPAVSRALARLRETFGDELLVRVGQQMRLTAKAEALFAPLQQVLSEVGDLVAPTTFDPAQAAGVLRLAAPDIITYMLGPPLLQRLAREAPQLDVAIVQWSSSWREQLASGEVDLTFGEAGERDRGIHSSLLVRNDWATVLRKGHPALRKRWCLDTFAELRHLLIGFTPHGGGHVDAALEALGKKRRVALRMPYVVLSPLMVAESDLVLTTARWLALKFAQPMGLVVKTPPVELKLAPVDLPMVWHERTHREPKQRWLRAQLAGLAREAGMVRPTQRTMKMLPSTSASARRR
jgi:DNA-binding transcriptional LysR family regulator